MEQGFFPKFISEYIRLKTKSMKTIKSILLGTMVVIAVNLPAQQLYKTYYDYKKTKVHEEYGADSYGVKNGSYKEYSEYGGIIVQGTYKNDKKIGIWTGTLDGKNKVVETYDNDGNKTGLWTTNCLDFPTFKYSEGHYFKGKEDGIWKTYFCEAPKVATPGNIKSIETYSAGVKNGKCTYYYNENVYDKSGYNIILVPGDKRKANIK